MPNRKSKEELKPCPFCGNKTLLFKDVHNSWFWQKYVFYIECEKCHARGPLTPSECEDWDHSNADEKWNRRSELAQPKGGKEESR